MVGAPWDGTLHNQPHIHPYASYITWVFIGAHGFQQLGSQRVPAFSLWFWKGLKPSTGSWLTSAEFCKAIFTTGRNPAKAPEMYESLVKLLWDISMIFTYIYIIYWKSKTIKIIVPNFGWLQFPTKKIAFGEYTYSFNGLWTSRVYIYIFTIIVNKPTLNGCVVCFPSVVSLRALQVPNLMASWWWIESGCQKSKLGTVGFNQPILKNMVVQIGNHETPGKGENKKIFETKPL